MSPTKLVVAHLGCDKRRCCYRYSYVLKEKIDFAKVGVVAGTLKWFAFGVALAVVAMALSYLTSFALAAIAASMTKKWEHPYVFRWSKDQAVATDKSCVPYLRNARCVRLVSSIFGWNVRCQRRHYPSIEQMSCPAPRGDRRNPYIRGRASREGVPGPAPPH
jgi:hypothetical protein